MGEANSPVLHAVYGGKPVILIAQIWKFRAKSYCSQIHRHHTAWQVVRHGSLATHSKTGCGDRSRAWLAKYPRLPKLSMTTYDFNSDNHPMSYIPKRRGFVQVTRTSSFVSGLDRN